EGRTAPLPRHGHRRRCAARRPVPDRSAAALRLPALPRDHARGRHRLRDRRRHLAVPRRRPRLALPDLPHRRVHARAARGLGHGLPRRHPRLRDGAPPLLLGRAPRHPASPGRARRAGL
ncbi:MAG: hypothetical protein AVDCRST_MAG60-1010, partial [uncultured Nocardioides sp.]